MVIIFPSIPTLNVRWGESFSQTDKYPLPALNSNHKILIHKEFIELVDNDYELAVFFLHQLYYHSLNADSMRNKGISINDELSISEIRKRTLSNRADQTIRRKLNQLEKLGFITSHKNTLYQCRMYEIHPNIYLDDFTIAGVVEIKDLLNKSCYEKAALINKLLTEGYSFEALSIYFHILGIKPCETVATIA